MEINYVELWSVCNYFYPDRSSATSNRSVEDFKTELISCQTILPYWDIRDLASSTTTDAIMFGGLTILYIFMLSSNRTSLAP